MFSGCHHVILGFDAVRPPSPINKENNVFKDALGVKGLGFKHHGNQLIIPVIMVLIMVIIMVIIMIIIVIIMVVIMLNNFCFHVNSQKCQVVRLSDYVHIMFTVCHLIWQ